MDIAEEVPARGHGAVAILEVGEVAEGDDLRVVQRPKRTRLERDRLGVRIDEHAPLGSSEQQHLAQGRGLGDQRISLHPHFG